MGLAAEEGNRWPFEDGVEVSLNGDLACVAALAFCCLARVLGLRLRDRARFSRLESDVSGSESSEMMVGEERRSAAERVMGAK